MKLITLLKTSSLIFVIVASIFSCKKADVTAAETQIPSKPSDTTTVTVPKPPPPTDPVDNAPFIEVGTGSGALILKNYEGKNFKIQPGTYSYFQFENLTNCKVSGLNQVKIVGGNVTMNTINGLTLSGISIIDSKYRAFNFSKEANDLILKDIELSNIGDVCMVFDINKKYNGTPASYSNNIQLVNIKANNISTFFGAQGTITNDGFTGLIKNFKMTGCTITNSPNLADGVYIGCAEDYEISNNVINNVNSANGNHNGIFHILGTGKIFNNTCTNHQGNLVRAWLFNITKTSTVEIYNNKVYNSTRYGAFELQVPLWIKELAAFKPANAKIYNNTVGKLNTGVPKYFEGRLLDLYMTYGTVEIYNNLSFDLYDNIMINNMSSTTISVNSGNVYKATAGEAVSDLISFRSIVPGVGAN